MAEEHIGKKRRKEVRQAIDMQKELRKTTVLVFVVFAIALLAMVLCTVLATLGVFGESSTLVVQVVPLVIVFVGIMVLSFRMVGYWDLRESYKQHCKKFNITKDDMKALERGEL